MRMEIIVNGNKRSVPADYTAAQLVEALALGQRRIAMEVNEEIVPRSCYPQHRFNPGDRIEIVHAVGGG
jgi:sulfur carrier protein